MTQNNLKNWGNHLLITTYNYTKNERLRSIIVKEILLRSATVCLERI